MKCTILLKQPLSYNTVNSDKKERYATAIQNSFRRTYRRNVHLKGDLYGVVHYYYNKNKGLDADNISKPLWDSLTEKIFDDDKQVILRIASAMDLTKFGYQSIDMSSIPDLVYQQLLDALLDEKEDILYIEIGEFSPKMLKFNIEEYGV